LLLLVSLHPFVTYPLSLRLIRRFRRPASSPTETTTGQNDSPPSFAVCVCAYNEGTIIRTTIENLLALRQSVPDLQILVHVDGNADGTADIAQEYADRIDLAVSPERKGKTYGMNRLLSMARASIVVLTDATVRIDQTALPNLVKYFADPTVGCVCGHLQYVNLNETATAYVGSFYWRLEESTKQLESQTGSVMGADGSIYALRRSLFKPVPEDMIDDFYISMNVLCDGYRIVRAPDVLAYEKSVTDPREEFRRKIRISCQAFHAHRVLRSRIAALGRLDRYKYLSHKWIRWFTGYTLSVAAILFLSGLAIVFGFTVAAVTLGVGLAVVGLGYVLRIHPITKVVDILLSFLATAIGVGRAMSGHRIRTWEPARSIRKAEEAAYD
jgi:cellulose synthase/poly-beta-1,6-N-acetylglucosamine synthase-like glycosyltransferase